MHHIVGDPQLHAVKPILKVNIGKNTWHGWPQLWSPWWSVWRVALSNSLQLPRTKSMNILHVYDISYFGVTWHDATWGVCLTLTLGGWWSVWRVGGGLQPMHPFRAPRTMVTTHNALMLYIMRRYGTKSALVLFHWKVNQMGQEHQTPMCSPCEQLPILGACSVHYSGSIPVHEYGIPLKSEPGWGGSGAPTHVLPCSPSSPFQR